MLLLFGLPFLNTDLIAISILPITRYHRRRRIYALRNVGGSILLPTREQPGGKGVAHQAMGRISCSMALGFLGFRVLFYVACFCFLDT